MATKTPKTAPTSSKKAPLRSFRLAPGIAIIGEDGTRHSGLCEFDEATCKRLKAQGHGDYEPESSATED